MDAEKAKALEAAGWRIGTVQELLDLSDEDMAYIDAMLALEEALKNTQP